MPRLPTRVSDYTGQSSRRSTLATSVVVNDLIAASNNRKNPLLLEIDSLRQKLVVVPDDIPFDSLRNRPVREIAQMLVRLRSLYFRRRLAQQDDIAEVIQELSHEASMQDAYSDPAVQDLELGRPFHSLLPQVRDQFWGNVQYQVHE